MMYNIEVDKRVFRALDQTTTLNQLLLESSENSYDNISLENFVIKISSLQEELPSLKKENEALKENMIQYYHDAHEPLPF